MNILEKLGFNKRGAAQGNEHEIEYEKGLLEFADKNPRDQSETRIYNLIILDESGSMTSIRDQALTGVNETIQTIRTAQKENPDDHQMFCFVTFDQGGCGPDVRVIIDNEKIENVGDIKPEQYRPNGMTPLYDAMGLSITALQKLVKEGDYVLVTVVTDGYENASHLYTDAMIKELVESLSQKGWVFTYIGANQDSEQTAGGLGISSTMDFKADAMGTAMMWEKMLSSSREYYKQVRYSKITGQSINYNEDFFSQKQALNRVTPDHIVDLKDGQVFVFGSNAEGYHDGGAARFAMERFGAIYGQGRGLQGRSYAIPTMSGSLQEIAHEVQNFIQFADSHPELTFLVTRIGCGIAGYTDHDIAPLFANAYSLPNVYLPTEFWKELNYKFK